MALYRVRTIHSGATGSPGVSTMYFDASAGSAQQAATAVGAFWATVDDKMAAGLTWATENEVATINSSTGELEAITGVTNASGSGGVGASAVPRIAQALLRLRTGTFAGGREIRGRLFIPNITESDNDTGGVPSINVKAQIDGAAATLMAAANTDWVVWSRKNSSFSSITSATTWSEWASLRSRRD